MADIEQRDEFGHLQNFANVLRRVVQLDSLQSLTQADQHAQHPAGNQNHARQIEGENLALLFVDQLEQLIPVSRDADFIRDVLTCKSDARQRAGLIDFQHAGFGLGDVQFGISLGWLRRIVENTVAHEKAPQGRGGSAIRIWPGV